MSDDDMFSRWSKRKRKVAAETEVAVEVVEEGVEPVVEPETDEEEAALLAKLELPVPESLKEGDDFSVFMQAHVPQFLRKRALRVLWRSNPVLACVDGLNDYDDDFNSPELTQKVLATGYQVGRGFLRDVVKLAEDEGETEPLEEFAEGAEEPVEEVEVAVISDAPEVRAPVEESDAEVTRPRRMRFET